MALKAESRDTRWKWLRSTPILAYWAIVFIFSGIVVNAIQLLTLLLIWPVSHDPRWSPGQLWLVVLTRPAMPMILLAYRKINAKVVLLNWTMLICLAERWANVQLRVFGDPRIFKDLGQHKAIAIVNHPSDLDWLFGWLIADKFGVLGNTKCVLKSTLRFVPVLGWTWWFIEYIFLSRNWEGDRRHMSSCFRQLDDFCLPYWMVIFCEGTRFTPEKHAKSVAFCQEKGLTPFKNLLYPRIKGFHLMRDELRNIEHVLNVTLAFPTGVPTLADLVFDAKALEVHAYVGRDDLSTVPADEAGVSEFVIKTYAAMDARLDAHHATGIFAGHEELRPKSLLPLVVSLGWSTVLAALLVWTLVPRLLAGSFFHLGLFVAIFALGWGMVHTGLWFAKKGKSGGPRPKSVKPL